MDNILQLVRIFTSTIFLFLLITNYFKNNQSLHAVIIILALFLTGISIVIGHSLLTVLWGINLAIQLLAWMSYEPSPKINSPHKKVDIHCDHCGTNEKGNCPNCGAPLHRHEH